MRVSQTTRSWIAARGEQQLPAPGHRRDGDQGEQRGERDPPRARRAQDVPRLAEVDLEQDVRDGAPRDEERQRDAQPALHAAEPRVHAAERRDRIAHVVVRVRRRERQRQHLRPGAFGHRQRRLAGREPVAVGAQLVHRQEVDRAADVLVGKSALHVVAVGEGHTHDVEVVRMQVAVVARDRRDTFETGKALLVDRDVAPANLGVMLDLVQLDERDRREDVAEIRLVAGHGDVVERAVPAPHDAQVVERLGEVVAVRGDQPAFAGGDVLRRVEREARQVGDRADLAPAVERLGCVRCVLDERQAERRKLVEVGGLAVEIDGDDRLRALVDELAHAGRIDVERVVANVGEDGRRATVDDHVRRRGPGDRRRDHLVAGPDTERDERQVERRGARGDGEHVLCLEVVAHAGLELGRARSRRQPARPQRLRDGVDLRFGDRRGLEREEGVAPGRLHTGSVSAESLRDFPLCTGRAPSYPRGPCGGCHSLHWRVPWPRSF